MNSPVWIGIDVGSITCKVLVLDETERIVASTYRRTQGRVVDTVKDGLAAVGDALADRYVVGCATTGSARRFVGALVGADVVINEITAHARAAIRIRLKSDVEEDRETVASVPFLIVGRTASPPKVDGKLDDWPMRVGNTARDFRLIGRRGRKGSGLAQRQSQFFLLCDEANLYIAARCGEPNPSGMVTRPNNIVHYEQLMACGEDLVEILLDPGGKAAGPEGLYHLVVKPNGVLVTERGVRTDPPLGKTVHWSPAATVAIGRQNGAWTVEMSVPLAAFGEDGKAAFWRANFTRYATQGAEASSWSGAPRYFYDPRNLGTIFMGAAAASERRSPG